jgi:hypothetical protein
MWYNMSTILRCRALQRNDQDGGRPTPGQSHGPALTLPTLVMLNLLVVWRLWKTGGLRH